MARGTNRREEKIFENSLISFEWMQVENFPRTCEGIEVHNSCA